MIRDHRTRVLSYIKLCNSASQQLNSMSLRSLYFWQTSQRRTFETDKRMYCFYWKKNVSEVFFDRQGRSELRLYEIKMKQIRKLSFLSVWNAITFQQHWKTKITVLMTLVLCQLYKYEETDYEINYFSGQIINHLFLPAPLLFLKHKKNREANRFSPRFSGKVNIPSTAIYFELTL